MMPVPPNFAIEQLGPFNDLVGPLPAAIGDCTSLNSAYGRNNSLTGLPTGLGLLTIIQYVPKNDINFALLVVIPKQSHKQDSSFQFQEGAPAVVKSINNQPVQQSLYLIQP
jgi:hypothetical protein